MPTGEDSIALHQLYIIIISYTHKRGFIHQPREHVMTVRWSLAKSCQAQILKGIFSGIASGSVCTSYTSYTPTTHNVHHPSPSNLVTIFKDRSQAIAGGKRPHVQIRAGQSRRGRRWRSVGKVARRLQRVGFHLSHGVSCEVIAVVELLTAWIYVFYNV